VCPLIEESETLQLQTAVETYETLAAALPELKVGWCTAGCRPPTRRRRDGRRSRATTCSCWWRP
jgi:RecG-like helicase